jgi:hypothetical protein
LKTEYVNRTVLLAGPKAYTISSTLSLLCTTLGLRPDAVPVQSVGIEQYVSYHSSSIETGARTTDPAFLRGWATTYEGMKMGEIAVTDNGTLEKLLGRKPKTLEDMADLVFSEKGTLERYGRASASK